MADVPSNISKMLDNEVDVDSPLSEALLTKMASNINGLIDTLANSVTFTSNTTFQIPENVRRIFVLGAGGGGGGGGGQSSGSAAGRGGGAGAVPRGVILPVTPLSTITITIGAGGTGGVTGGGSLGTPGNDGGFSRLNGTGIDVYFLGAKGASAGGIGGSGLASAPGGYTFGSDTVISCPGGNTAADGSNSIFASGGGSPTGGGGGAGFGNGGAGASSVAGNGVSAGANTSAGGGGAGGNTGTSGGNGGSGKIIIFY